MRGSKSGEDDCHPRVTSVPPAHQAGSTYNPQAPNCMKGRPLGNVRSAPQAAALGRHVPLLPSCGQHERCQGIQPSSPGNPWTLPSRCLLPRCQEGCRALGFPSGSKADLHRPFTAVNSDEAGTKIHRIKCYSISKGKHFLNDSAQQKENVLKSIYQDSILKPHSNHATF